MAQITKGILGGFSGTVGNVIGGSWKGISYMRSQPSKRSGTSTQPQLDQQAKFKMVVRFFQPMTALLGISFKGFTAKMSGFNSAVSYTLKNAVSGSYPAFDLDYPLALIARGDLPNATSPSAQPSGNGLVTFGWTNNAGMGKASDADKAILVVYCPLLNLSVYTAAGDARSTEMAVLNVASFIGQSVETYISFVSADGKDIANSIHTGHFNIS